MCTLIFDLHCLLYCNIVDKSNHDIANYFGQDSKMKMSDQFIWCSMVNFEYSKTIVFKCNPNGRLFVCITENIVGKRETAPYQHFLLFLQSFLNLSLLKSFKLGIIQLTHSHTMTPLTPLGKQAF